MKGVVGYGVGVMAKEAVISPGLEVDEGGRVVGGGGLGEWERPTWGDHLVVLVVAGVLAGYAAFSGKPLTLHEARLPQLARDMLGVGEWLLPFSGERPWLERPPFPHWWLMASQWAGEAAGVVRSGGGGEGAVWAARLPGAVAGALVMLLTMWSGARLFGRTVGLAAAVLLGSMYEFYFYAGQAEDDIYLALLVAGAYAAFVAAEFGFAGRGAVGGGGGAGGAGGQGGFGGVGEVGRGEVGQGGSVRVGTGRVGTWGAGREAVGLEEGGRGVVGREARCEKWWGWRSGARGWWVLVFCVLVGSTSLAKGPGPGVVQVLAGCGGYALWRAVRGDGSVLRRYLWVWGIAVSVAVFLAWPVVAYRAYPDVLNNWKYDLLGPFGHKPWWYYGVQLTWVTQPWTVVVVMGAVLTWPAVRRGDRAAVFAWCWAWLPVIMASVSSRKHHHYLVPMLAPMAILGALGLQAVGRWLLARPFGRKDYAGTLLIYGGIPAVGLGVAAGLGKLPGGWGWTAVLMGGVLAAVWGFAEALRRRRPGWMLGAFVMGLAVFYAYGQSVIAVRDESGKDDIAMLTSAAGRLERGKTVYILADNQLDFFRLAWYLRPPTRVLQNATYLRDERITDPWVYVLTRAGPTRGETAFVREELGELELVTQSPRSRAQEGPDDRFAIYKLTFKPGLKRYPAPPVGVVQAMFRYDAAEPGPYCGPGPGGK